MSLATTNAVDFVEVGDQLKAAWLDACQLQMAAERGECTWADVAVAWAFLARATPEAARMDTAIFWKLAGEAAAKARKR